MAGRKGDYERWITEEGLSMLEGWARSGLNDSQIAHNMGIAPETLCRWKSRFPQINQSLKKGKEVVDYEVENQLLKRAMGYEVTETREEVDNSGRKKTITTTRHVAPDVAAQIFWLKNRKPEKWKNKPDAGCVIGDTLQKARELLAGIPNALE